MPDAADAEEDGADGCQGEDHGAEGVVEAPSPRALLVIVGDHLKGEMRPSMTCNFSMFAVTVSDNETVRRHFAHLQKNENLSAACEFLRL